MATFIRYDRFTVTRYELTVFTIMFTMFLGKKLDCSPWWSVFKPHLEF